MDGSYYNPSKGDSISPLLPIKVQMQIHGVAEDKDGGISTVQRNTDELEYQAMAGHLRYGPVSFEDREDWTVELGHASPGSSVGFDLHFARPDEGSEAGSPIIIKVRRKGAGAEPTASSTGVELDDIRLFVTAEMGDAGLLVTLSFFHGASAPPTGGGDYEPHYVNSDSHGIIVTLRE